MKMKDELGVLQCGCRIILLGKDSEDEANMALVVSANPIHFKKAMKIANRRHSTDCEINSIEKDKTWSLVDLSVGAKKN